MIAETATHDALAGRDPIWARLRFWSVLALVATAPFWAASLPPFPDFPGHLGQFHIMLHLDQSPYLQKFYGYEWVLTGNLGVDLLMLVVGPLLGVERGTWAIAAATPALMVLGIFMVSRTIHGRVQPCAFLALPFVYASAFLLGFLNYDLGVALAFFAFAFWVKWNRALGLRAVSYIFIGLCLWVCHAAAWGLLCLMIGGYEFWASVRDRGWCLASAGRVFCRVLPLVPPILLSFSMVHQSTAPPPYQVVTSGLPSNMWVYKVFAFLGQLHDRVYALDVASILVLGLLYAFARFCGTSISYALAIPAALIGVAALLMPPVFSGSALADYRIAPVAIIIFMLSIHADVGRGQFLTVILALGLFGLRLTATALGWHDDDRAYRRHLFALQTVQAGARILVLVPTDHSDSHTYRPRPMGHLADLAIVRRDALVNTQWVNNGAKFPLRVKANTDTAYYADPSQYVSPDNVNVALKAARPNHFDYAWVLGRYPVGAQPENLIQIYADDETRLFRVQR